MNAKIPHPDWHWPDFGPVLCGQMTDRERLGLPDYYVTSRWEAPVQQAFSALYSASIGQLVEMLQSTHASLAYRLASGNHLALRGDPRINVMDPAMCPIRGGVVHIGLPTDGVDKVLEQFSGLGLDRSWIEKESPRHTVVLAPYQLAKYPVTNFEYRTFLLDAKYPEIPSSWTFRQYPAALANHPVYTVSAEAADAYTQWLSKQTGRTFRLPTEAEWEWAAAGPDALEFPWGSDFDADLLNTAETGLFSTSSVGAFVGGESPFGLCDMAGNVEEYVADNYAAYPGGPFISDHLTQIHGTYRVARGGSFARFRDLARTRRRHGHNPRSATYAMGFRLAETI